MCTSATRDPNSARYWRLNEMQGIQACLRSPSEAQDPEEFAGIIAQRRRLHELQAHEDRILARLRRISSRLRRS